MRFYEVDLDPDVLKEVVAERFLRKDVKIDPGLKEGTSIIELDGGIENHTIVNWAGKAPGLLDVYAIRFSIISSFTDLDRLWIRKGLGHVCERRKTVNPDTGVFFMQLTKEEAQKGSEVENCKIELLKGKDDPDRRIRKKLLDIP